ncbi:hypothetical protein PILCRDRAFT_672780 [Piloderma croceum F 1598]|uniref:Uncharacterized protein n=1 Tax=Piloderma croceum (strain F 1598) TaxID=765440 RepID=A0A0C3ANJ9_PILCF|nr:hypothetical protein PILCRDRAFT_672780 [Piloderma croceum F 1598]
MLPVSDQPSSRTSKRKVKTSPVNSNDRLFLGTDDHVGRGMAWRASFITPVLYDHSARHGILVELTDGMEYNLALACMACWGYDNLLRFSPIVTGSCGSNGQRRMLGARLQSWNPSLQAVGAICYMRVCSGIKERADRRANAICLNGSLILSKAIQYKHVYICVNSTGCTT